MRAGGCSVQQALTPEAANVVKQAVTLARRRGHAQVTPLHVANTMFTVSTGLFRTACLQSHSHPLQSRALELCFNVALNRLPASTSSPMLGAHISHQYPSISNALVAAFKRAQAHQRRGSIENQQQPLLSVKIELEQLITSILDDPSVSRVMREAGFSSTQVKINVEQAISSMENSSQNKPREDNTTRNSQTPPGSISCKPTISDRVRDEDVMYVMDNLVNSNKRSTVIVGESLASIEGVVRRVKENIIKGDVHEVLKNVKFMSLDLSSFRHHTRVEIDQKIEEIKSLCSMGSGVILFLGDLKLVAEYRSNSPSIQERSYYCSVEHIIHELGKLVSGTEESKKFWLMGIATSQDYMRIKSHGSPSLESILGLHAITIPSGFSLQLSLVTDSESQSEMNINKADSGANWLHQGEEEILLNCCAECSAKYRIEAQSLQNSACNNNATSSSLPAWLKQYKDQSRGQTEPDKDCASIRELCKKWKSYCNSVHKHSSSPVRTLSISPISPSSSTSAFSHDQQCLNLQPTHHDFWTSQAANYKNLEPNFYITIPQHNNGLRQAFSSNPNSTPNSASSSDNAMDNDQYVQKFKEINVENSKILSDALQKNVPWQKDIIPEIVSTILRCRARLVKRKGMSNNSEIKEETWFFFQGVDVQAKEKIARELAKVIFGSQENFFSIALSSFLSTRADSSKECRNKRSRDEPSGSYIERLTKAMSRNPHRVFFLEDIDQADYTSQMGFRRAMESGRLTNSNGEEVCLSDSIIILSCDNFSSRSGACSPTSKQKVDICEGVAAMEETTSPCVSLDLNISIHDQDMIYEDELEFDNIGLLEGVDRRVVFKIQQSY